MNCQDVVLYVCMDTGRYQSPLYFHFTVTHEKETASTCAADLSWVSDRCRMAPFLDALRYKFSSSESIVRVSRASASMSPWSPFHLHSAAPMFDVRSCFPCVPPKILEPCPRSGRGMFHCAGIDAKHSSREPVGATLLYLSWCHPFMLPRFFAQTRLASECALQAHLCYSWSGVRSSHYLVHPSRRRVGRPHRNSARPPSTCRAVSLVTLPCLDTLVACYIASRCFNHNQRSHNAGVPCPGVCSHSHENARTHTHSPPDHDSS